MYRYSALVHKLSVSFQDIGEDSDTARLIFLEWWFKPESRARDHVASCCLS